MDKRVMKYIEYEIHQYEKYKKHKREIEDRFGIPSKEGTPRLRKYYKRICTWIDVIEKTVEELRPLEKELFEHYFLKKGSIESFCQEKGVKKRLAWKIKRNIVKKIAEELALDIE